MGWYLCYFMHRHLDFRVAEFTALAELAGCGDTLQWRKPHGDAEHSPLWHVWLPSDAHAEETLLRMRQLQQTLNIRFRRITSKQILAALQLLLILALSLGKSLAQNSFLSFKHTCTPRSKHSREGGRA